MKIRSNYVSNSSSSSFIVEFDDIVKVIRVAGEEISINDFFDSITNASFTSSDSEMHEITYDEDDRNDLLEYIDQLIEWASDEDKLKLNELKLDIKKSKDKIYSRFDIDCHDKVLNFILKILSKYGALKIKYCSAE